MEYEIVVQEWKAIWCIDVGVFKWSRASTVCSHQPRNASSHSLQIQGCEHNWKSPQTSSDLVPQDMGLPQRMENLHAPTVPSGPTSGPVVTDGTQTSGLTFPQLQAKKDNIEAELRALGSVLESVGSASARHI
jgi:hypothetical protein